MKNYLLCFFLLVGSVRAFAQLRDSVRLPVPISVNYIVNKIEKGIYDDLVYVEVFITNNGDRALYISDVVTPKGWEVVGKESRWVPPSNVEVIGVWIPIVEVKGVNGTMKLLANVRHGKYKLKIKESYVSLNKVTED